MMSRRRFIIRINHTNRRSLVGGPLIDKSTRNTAFVLRIKGNIKEDANQEYFHKQDKENQIHFSALLAFGYQSVGRKSIKRKLN